MTRPRRALLFVPATERRRIEKAASLGVDAVILDLEDGAAQNKKAEAREVAVSALAEVDFGKSERIVRINPIGSGLENDDLRALAAAKRPPNAILLPKAESADDVRALASEVASMEDAKRVASGSIRVIALIESARGVVRLGEIAAAHPRLVALAFGAEDFAGDVGATRTKQGHEVAWARSALVVHAAAHRLQAIDSPYVDLNDVGGLAADTRTALELGYSGRFAIHPRQLDPIVAVFTPTPDELSAADRLLSEHARHQAAGRGVFELDGKMVDMPMVRAAERVVARARAAGLR